MGPSSHPHPLPPPSPSPSWAEVLRGGVERSGERPPDPRSHTGNSCGPPSTPTHNPAVSPLPSPSSLDQFKAWLWCKAQGYSARLVLETSCGMEEITFWCRPSTASNSTVAGTKQAKRVKSARRKRPRQKEAAGLEGQKKEQDSSGYSDL